MQIRKVEGLDNLLRSLSLEDKGGQTRHVVYPWGDYSSVVGDDVAFWYSEERCKYGTLRKIISEAFDHVGHPRGDRLADGAVMAFVLMPKTADTFADFEKLLAAFVSADVSQYLFIPAVALFKMQTPGEEATYDMIDSFGHGPFRYVALDRGLMARIKYRLERVGVDNLVSDLDKFFGCIAVHKGPHEVKVLDFSALGFKGYQTPIAVALIQYYFDDLSRALFEQFWREHSETQFLSVASGALLLDRSSLESLPGTAWLSIFWGFTLLRGNGMVSMITETRHLKGTLALRVYSLRKQLTIATKRLENEITTEFGAGPHNVCHSLLNFGRLVARSSEMEQKNYIEESFTLLMVAMESLLSDKESIAATLSRRAGAIRAASGREHFHDSVKLLSKLYGIRSKFVHEGDAVPSESLSELQDIARQIFFTAYRSQTRFLDAGGTRENWKPVWIAELDYISACFDVGILIDADLAKRAGIRAYHPDLMN